MKINKNSSHYRDGYTNGLEGYTDKDKAMKFARDEAPPNEIHVAEYWSGSLDGIKDREGNKNELYRRKLIRYNSFIR